MITDKPLFGHGIGGFQREYMLYQAEYFKNHPDSNYAMLADIVKHPFNEFLLLVEQGLVGGLLVGLFIFFLSKNTVETRV
jgi:Lipid A core - O-antigen ligase and related enzymes